MSLLIKNGRIITADDDYSADIFVEDEKITEIKNDLNINADKIIDAAGTYVIPGGIDVHTHLDMPYGKIKSTDDFESGTVAAAFGGTTTIIDFPTQTRGKSLQEALQQWFKKAEGKAVIDYGFHMIVTDISDSFIDDMKIMVDEGITSFKLFMAYPGRLMLDDASIFKVMQQAAKLDALICMHAENGGVIDVLTGQALKEGKTEPVYHALTRPPVTEAEAVNRTIALAEIAKAPVYIVHVSSYDALQKIAEARSNKLTVYAETCPQYLFLSLDDLAKENFEGAKYVFTPPVRESWHQQKLWEGLQNNSLQIVSTDHCPFYFEGHKDLGKNDFTKIPGGGPGIENRLQLLFHHGVNSRKVSLKRWVEIISTNPAKLFGMYPQKGELKVGSDADIVLWNPELEHTISSKTHHMNVDYSMYEGMQVKGNAQTVISRGKVIVENKKFTGKVGRGKFLKRNLFENIWE